MRYVIVCCLSLLLSTGLFANTPSRATNIKHVIYITLDGVRWQDIFLTQAHFPKLWRMHADALTFYGMPQSNTTMEVASTPISLPSYQSQMSGAIQPCQDNHCGRIQVETLPEYLIQKLSLSKKDVVTFSSWHKIEDAIEHIADTTYVNAGNRPAYDPYTHTANPTMDLLNNVQENDQPFDGTRYDKYTFAQALHYFQTYQPLFMWISVVESDEAAHKGHLAYYEMMLRYYDEMLDKIFVTLKNMHLYENTLVIVTTDHGRGNGTHWTDHGPQYPESKQTWAFVLNGKLKPMGQDGNITHYSTLSIRPTIEAALDVSCNPH